MMPAPGHTGDIWGIAENARYEISGHQVKLIDLPGTTGIYGVIIPQWILSHHTGITYLIGRAGVHPKAHQGEGT